MNRLIGHAKSNLQMIEDDKYCIDIINQNQAVISALQKVNESLLKRHLETCVVDSVTGRSRKKREKALEEIYRVFSKKK